MCTYKPLMRGDILHVHLVLVHHTYALIIDTYQKATSHISATYDVVCTEPLTQFHTTEPCQAMPHIYNGITQTSLEDSLG